MEQIFIKLAKEQVNEVEMELDAESTTSCKLQHKSVCSPGNQVNMKEKYNSILPLWAKGQGQGQGQGQGWGQGQGPGRVWGMGFFTGMKSIFKNAFDGVRRNSSSGKQRCKEQRIFPGNSFDNFIDNNNQNLNEDGIDVDVEVGVDDHNEMGTISSSCPIKIIDPLGPETSILLMTSSDYIPISTDGMMEEEHKGEIVKEKEEGGNVLKEKEEVDSVEVILFF